MINVNIVIRIIWDSDWRVVVAPRRTVWSRFMYWYVVYCSTHRYIQVGTESDADGYIVCFVRTLHPFAVELKNQQGAHHWNPIGEHLKSSWNAYFMTRLMIVHLLAFLDFIKDWLWALPIRVWAAGTTSSAPWLHNWIGWCNPSFHFETKSVLTEKEMWNKRERDNMTI